MTNPVMHAAAPDSSASAVAAKRCAGSFYSVGWMGTSFLLLAIATAAYDGFYAVGTVNLAIITAALALLIQLLVGWQNRTVWRQMAISCVIAWLWTFWMVLYGGQVLCHFHRLPNWFLDLTRLGVAAFEGWKNVCIDYRDPTGVLSIFGDMGWVDVSVTVEKLHPYVLIGLLTWAMVESRRFRVWYQRYIAIVVAAAVIVLFAVFRLVGHMLLEISADSIATYWNQPVLLLSYLPLPWLIAHAFGVLAKTFPAAELDGAAIGGRPWKWPLFVGSVAGAILAAAFFYLPYRPTANATVLLDDGHSNWEWAQGDFGVDSFGEKATYGSQLFVRTLGLYSKASVTTQPLTDELLKGVDVLILKTPTHPYKPSETEAVTRFVDRGGGLFLISDHTNLFGMSTFLNEVATRFGLTFNLDDQFELGTGQMTTATNRRWQQVGMLTGVPELPFLTGCTVECPFGGEVIVGKAMSAELVDYGHVNFFGDMKTERNESWGAFVQLAVVEHGRGRVAAFTDSTQMSNFCSTLASRARLFANVVGYLSCQSSAYRLIHSTLLRIVPVCFLLLAFVPLFENGRGVRGLAIGLASSVLCPALWIWLTPAVTDIVPPAKQDAIVTFEPDFSVAAFPDFATVGEPLPKEVQEISYDQFFANVARSGFIPTVGNPLGAREGRRHRLLLPPNSNDSRGAIAKTLPAWLENGQNVVAFVDWSPEETQAVLRDIARACSAKAVGQIVTHRSAGGKFFWTTLPVGAGRVTFVTGQKYFAAPYMGPVYAMANEERRVAGVLTVQLLKATLLSTEQAIPELIGKLEAQIDTMKPVITEVHSAPGDDPAVLPGMRDVPAL